jgi:5-methylthioadenosine/S-adenosylhomocysteine deaminase
MPVVPHGVVLEHHAVAVNQGRIVAVLPIAEARDALRAARDRVAPGHALDSRPGQRHTHNP